MPTEFNTQVGNGEYRLQFETDNKEHHLLMQSAARRCIDRAHMTNADNIRSMNDEMLDGFICSLLRCEFCKFGRRGGCDLLEWLQQPAEETER